LGIQLSELIAIAEGVAESSTQAEERRAHAAGSRDRG
jgi:hypothetical protein